MRTAPIVTLNARVATIPDGTAGIMATVRAVRAAIDAAKLAPSIIQAATAIIYLTPERDECAEVSALHEWVRDHVRYVRDPVGVESLTDPVVTLRRQSGDCDDQTALLGALLESVGYPTRLIIAAYQRAQYWEHIYLQAFCGDWINLDPTEHQPAGYAPPDPLSVWIEPR